MRNLIVWGTLVLAAAVAVGADGNGPPPWAYPVTTAAQPAKDDGTPKHVPGSSQAFTLTQIRSPFDVPDWHPDEHPAMPEVVTHGRAPDVRPCGYCHLPNGLGRPENASLAGLPASYIAQQVADFFEMKFEEIPGSDALLRGLLQGDWNHDFIVVEPGGKVESAMFGLKA